MNCPHCQAARSIATNHARAGAPSLGGIHLAHADPQRLKARLLQHFVAEGAPVPSHLEVDVTPGQQGVCLDGLYVVADAAEGAANLGAAVVGSAAVKHCPSASSSHTKVSSFDFDGVKH